MCVEHRLAPPTHPLPRLKSRGACATQVASVGHCMLYVELASSAGHDRVRGCVRDRVGIGRVPCGEVNSVCRNDVILATAVATERAREPQASMIGCDLYCFVHALGLN